MLSPFALEILTGLSTVLSVAAIVTAIRALGVKRFPRKMLFSLVADVEDVKDIQGQQAKLLKKLNARWASRAARERQNDPTPVPTGNDSWAQLPGETSEQWKARIRRTKLVRNERPE